MLLVANAEVYALKRLTVICRIIRLIAIDYTESAVRGRNTRGVLED